MEKETPVCGMDMHQNYQGEGISFPECVQVVENTALAQGVQESNWGEYASC